MARPASGQRTAPARGCKLSRTAGTVPARTVSRSGDCVFALTGDEGDAPAPRRWAPQLAAIMDEAEHDVLAYMTFPVAHCAKLHSTNPLERLHGEVKRRTNTAGIFPNEDAITRLIGAILLEQNDEWAVQ